MNDSIPKHNFSNILTMWSTTPHSYFYDMNLKILKHKDMVVQQNNTNKNINKINKNTAKKRVWEDSHVHELSAQQTLAAPKTAGYLFGFSPNKK